MLAHFYQLSNIKLVARRTGTGRPLEAKLNFLRIMSLSLMAGDDDEQARGGAGASVPEFSVVRTTREQRTNNARTTREPRTNNARTTRELRARTHPHVTRELRDAPLRPNPQPHLNSPPHLALTLTSASPPPRASTPSRRLPFSVDFSSEARFRFSYLSYVSTSAIFLVLPAGKEGLLLLL